MAEREHRVNTDGRLQASRADKKALDIVLIMSLSGSGERRGHDILLLGPTFMSCPENDEADLAKHEQIPRRYL